MAERNTSDYQQLLFALLPQGAVWPRDPDSTLGRTLAALAEELARVDARALDLLDEADPRTAYELLPDWEKTCGLPDACAGLGASLQERRAAVVARVTHRGGQSPAYFQGLAASLGYAATVSEHQPFRAGQGRAGDPVYGPDWIFAWRVTTAQTAPRALFRAGQSAAGERLASWGLEPLECAVRAAAPAHTHVIFSYT